MIDYSEEAIIRQEIPGDSAAVFTVNEKAFGGPGRGESG
jgi:predicted N-acetyltransferase YhbS